jgi:chitinase
MMSFSRTAGVMALLVCGLMLIGKGALAAPPVSSVPPIPNNHVWVCAYYLSGDEDTGRLPPQDIDFGGISHLIHFGIFPNANGSLGPYDGVISLKDSMRVIALAHAAGRKVLVCMGTDENAAKLHTAWTDAVRPTLVRNLVQFVMSRGYDGLDLDVEPLQDADVPTYIKFVHELRAAMDAAKPGLLLTSAVASEPAMFAQLQGQFDRINLMTYDDSGPWKGFKSWYNSSLYGAGTEMMNSTEPYPSVNDQVQPYLKAGIAPAKLGIGVAFYGYIWDGVSGPKQNIQGITSDDVNDGADYRLIMDQYYQPNRYHWDAQADAPWLGIDAPNPKDRKFISYDDARLCALKMDYVRQQGLGGVIIWELGAGYRPHQPMGQRNVLLEAIKHAWTGKLK